MDSYKARQFDLSNLKGISDKTLEMHFKLYEGYIKETNKLNGKISEFVKGGKVDQDEFAEYSELNRRLGFEYNGMVLHEYYFDNLKKGGGHGRPQQHVRLSQVGRRKFRQLRHLESRVHRHRQDARGWLGHLLSESDERRVIESLDHFA